MARGLVRYPGSGCVVEFMQGNAPQLAWVLEEQNGKLRLLLPNRRETSLASNRVLPWAGPSYSGLAGKEAAIAKLEEHKARREAAEAEMQPLDLWETAQGEVSRASADWFMELVRNDPDVDDVAACGHALLKCKSHFRFQPPEFEILPAEVVAARIAEQEATRRRESLVNGGSAFFRQLWEIHQRKRGTPDPRALDEEVLSHVRRLLLDRLSNPESQEEAPLWRGLIQGLPDDPFLPLYLAQAWNLVEPHHNFWLDRIDYAAGDAWSHAHSAEVETLLSYVRQGEGAAPDTNLSFISIDAPVTRDIDDAFSISPLPDGGWRLTLALACPAARWPFGGDLGAAVHQRASSLYLPETTHNMLPEILGTDGYSLHAGKTKPAFLVTCEVRPDGGVTTCTPAQSTVRIAANLTYDQCEAVLDERAARDNPALPFADQLHQAAALAAAYRSLRLRNGAVIIERPDLQLSLEGHGEETRVVLDVDDAAPAAHHLVSELMVLANAALAVWAGEHDVPLLHRTQDVAIPPECGGVWTKPQDIARVARALAPAMLEVTPRPHAGLGEKRYAPSSSPLRRYPDLVNEAQILHVLHEGTPRWSGAELNELLARLNLRLDAVAQVQRARPRYWKLLHFRQQGEGHWWPAVVTDETDTSVTVNLPREQLIVRARRALFSERTYRGQPVEVRLTKVRPLHNDFQLAEVRDVY